jgi:hypothetical protein
LKAPIQILTTVGEEVVEEVVVVAVEEVEVGMDTITEAATATAMGVEVVEVAPAHAFVQIATLQPHTICGRQLTHLVEICARRWQGRVGTMTISTRLSRLAGEDSGRSSSRGTSWTNEIMLSRRSNSTLPHRRRTLRSCER